MKRKKKTKDASEENQVGDEAASTSNLVQNACIWSRLKNIFVI